MLFQKSAHLMDIQWLLNFTGEKENKQENYKSLSTNKLGTVNVLLKHAFRKHYTSI